MVFVGFTYISTKGEKATQEHKNYIQARIFHRIKQQDHKFWGIKLILREEKSTLDENKSEKTNSSCN